MNIIEQIRNGLIQGDDASVGKLTQEAVKQGIAVKKILDKGLISGMEVVGAKFKEHEIFLPEVLLAAQAMNAGMDIIKPLFEKSGAPGMGRVVLGTVLGDIHDIGKNLVGIMLKGAGFDVIDLGNDVAPDKFVATAQKENAQVIGMSSLLTTTMPVMKEVVDLVKEKKLEVKTIIGGAPVTREYAKEIGADGYGYDAVSAVERIRKLVNG
jgi:5-methyltetrahydrofolate--homocysteine methyltransferase